MTAVRKPRLRVAEVRFFASMEDAAAFGMPGCDGFVWYEIENDEPGEVARAPDGSMHRDVDYYYITQPFQRGGSCIKSETVGLVWGWDGNREAPTLTPEFLFTNGSIRIHLHLREGRIDLLSDSTVSLEASS